MQKDFRGTGIRGARGARKRPHRRRQAQWLGNSQRIEHRLDCRIGRQLHCVRLGTLAFGMGCGCRNRRGQGDEESSIHLALPSWDFVVLRIYSRHPRHKFFISFSSSVLTSHTAATADVLLGLSPTRTPQAIERGMVSQDFTQRSRLLVVDGLLERFQQTEHLSKLAADHHYVRWAPRRLGRLNFTADALRLRAMDRRGQRGDLVRSVVLHGDP